MEWIKEHKNNLMDFGLFLLLFIISFVVSFMIIHLWGDQILCYGFSYNISKRMIIYKDFNAVPTPLYFMIASIFIKIFGNYVISLGILDSLFMAAIGFILFKMIGYKGFIPFLFFIVFVPSPYNLMCLFFIFMILYCIHKEKYNDLFIAFIVGLVFITKQNIGVLLFIPMILYSKHKIKSIIIFTLPFLFLCIYFLYHQALYDFFDYAFFGLFDFSGNRYFNYSLLFITICCVIYLLFPVFKSRIQDKEALYILFFQFLIYPICDIHHFSPCFVLFLYYFLKKCKSKKIDIAICSLVCMYTVYAFCCVFMPIHISTKKDFLYLKSPFGLSNYMEEIYEKFDGDIENVYFDSDTSYLLKLYYDIPASKFDLFFDGNLGYFSKEKNIKELEEHCQKEKCTFIIYKDYGKDYQGTVLHDFITKHYKKIEEFHGREVYSSK